MSALERQLDALTAGGQTSALLVVDVQRSFADPAYLPWVEPAALDVVANTVTTIATLVDEARVAGVPVVWIQLGQTKDKPWSSSLWLRGIDPETPWPSPDEPCVLGTAGAEWYGMAPHYGELVITKRGYSGFFGTDLEQQLHERGIDWVTVVGLTVDCCVDATARDAFQAGLPVIVASDATAAYEADLQVNSLANIALNSAVILTAAEVSALWNRQQATL
ncbi:MULTISPECIES: cysteine hydrolase family protein [Subtercola]|uniref:Cysteine hydrolase n=1 Tax=Subtercola vilae TaxID=2056433 RepID=A0A4T2BVA9_9MICO|nr:MULTISPECIES: cysteine hydrolase [Subtercola]MEA9984658.1 cysteine hydrolase [Subtercola sp. RTI3]TIH35300.1 cysteine hydrolase [Subtercola vilae]